MSSDTKTPAEQPYAKVVQRIVREEFDAFEARALERERRITAQLLEILGQCKADRDSDKLRIEALEQIVEDHESRLRHLEDAWRNSQAKTDRPPPGEVS